MYPSLSWSVGTQPAGVKLPAGWLERHASVVGAAAVEFASVVSLMAVCLGLMAEFS